MKEFVIWPRHDEAIHTSVHRALTPQDIHHSQSTGFTLVYIVFVFVSTAESNNGHDSSLTFLCGFVSVVFSKSESMELTTYFLELHRT